MTKTAELADVVLPATAAWAETEGTVTNSERRVQRVRKAIDGPRRRPRRPRDHLRPRQPDGRRLGRGRRRSGLERGPPPVAGPCRDELRPSRGARRASSGRATTRPTRASCSSTRGSGRIRSRATACRSCAVDHDPPVDKLDDDFPIRLTTGRRLDSYNTGVQTGGLHVAASARREPRHQPRGRRALRPRRRRARPGRVAPRPGRGRRSGSTRRCGRASRS